MGKVAIVIVVYNQKQNIELLFKSLKSQSFTDFRVYLIDNNSSDNSLEHAQLLNDSLNLDVKYISLKENTGFAKGNNIGAEEAIKDGYEYIFILNNDVELEKDCIMKLTDLINTDSRVGIAAPILFYWTKDKKLNNIQEYGASIDFRRYRFNKLYAGEIYENIADRIPETLEVDFVSGGATLIKSEVIKKIGLWDERYFAYGDEIDLSKRVLETSYKLLVTKHAKAWHFHNWEATNKKGYYIEYYLSARNKYTYFYKHKFYFWLFFCLFEDLVKFPVRLKWFKKVCDYKLGAYYLKGLWDGVLKKSGKPKLRFFQGV